MLSMDATLLDHLFPCRLQTSSDHRIVAAGPSITRWHGADLIGARMADAFDILRPRRAAIVSAQTLFILRSRRIPALTIRGGIIGAEASGLHLLLGAVPTDAIRAAINIKHSDFAPSDGATELLMSLQTRDTLLEEAQILARQLTDARDAAESANNAKSQFIGNMSHELRTPLNAIIGYSELIREEVAGTDAAASVHDVDRVLAAANHLLELINEILDMAKIEAGMMRAEFLPVDFPVLLEEVADTIQPIARKKDNQLILEIAPDLGAGRSDPLKLRQCLLNLLGNAVKFTSHGQVRLVAKRAAANLSNMIEITVADTGIGMSSAQLEKLFQPFLQASESTTRLYGGTGLGLVITRHLANLLGGDVSVRSIEGVGSEFTLQLPRDSTINSFLSARAQFATAAA